MEEKAPQGETFQVNRELLTSDNRQRFFFLSILSACYLFNLGIVRYAIQSFNGKRMKLNKNATMRLAIFTICEVFLKAAEPLKRRNDHSYVMPRRLRGLLSSSFFPCGVSSAHSPFDVSSFLLRQRAKPKFASKFSPRIFSPCQFRAFLISEQDFKFSLTNLKVCEKNRHFGVTF